MRHTNIISAAALVAFGTLGMGAPAAADGKAPKQDASAKPQGAAKPEAPAQPAKPAATAPTTKDSKAKGAKGAGGSESVAETVDRSSRQAVDEAKVAGDKSLKAMDSTGKKVGEGVRDAAKKTEDAANAGAHKFRKKIGTE